MKTKFKHQLTALVCLTLTALSGQASTTKVGNGDDGSDLEELTEIKSGPIFESRQKAVAHLQKLNVQGVKGLGALIPEVEKAQLFSVKNDVKSNLPEDEGAFHTTFNGLVFARTMPEPHSPTRFFPAASSLSEEQLIALHIHEGLHRALSPAVRQDESRVAQLTLAITSPGSNNDRVQAAATKYIPDDHPSSAGVTAAALYPIPDNARVKKPSVFGYTFQKFTQSADSETLPVENMHTFQSLLYPFGSETNPIGIGIEASVLKYQNESQLGPLGISARMRLWSVRGFDIGGWATASLNTLSSEELKNSPYGRDVYSLGLSVRRDLKNFYVENIIGVTTPGDAKQTLGKITYTHHYGSIVNASVKAGARIGSFMVGGFGEILLSDNYKLTGPGFEDETGRYQIVGAGPDIGFEQDWWAMRVFGRYVVSSSKGADFTTLGNIMGKGAGQGSVGAQISVLF